MGHYLEARISTILGRFADDIRNACEGEPKPLDAFPEEFVGAFEAIPAPAFDMFGEPMPGPTALDMTLEDLVTEGRIGFERRGDRVLVTTLPEHLRILLVIEWPS